MRTKPRSHFFALLPAEELSQGYYNSTAALEPNDQLNPSTIRDWVQQAFPPIEQPRIHLIPNRQMSVELLRDFSRASKHTWRVIPVEVGNEIRWIDPAGFPLASCQRPENWQSEFLHKFDFELNSNEHVITSNPYL
ncbi:hypothetical protein [uncultured Nostoc sp.]|uniref:hypothetical protein n=1 Tax=uncultured Nostoc sp. TaxID=340711 RepID=UPI002621D090|nr:hypothetical protein [uncultured Nostoc sp.]